MPNLGQGGCQALEDMDVIAQELQAASKRSEVPQKLQRYQQRRLVRSAAVQGLSRFASDIIIRGFDTPAKITRDDDGSLKFENFNYAGIVTKMLQPILPLFFTIQFAFLYDGWRNDKQIDLRATVGVLLFGGLIASLIAIEVVEAGIGLRVGAGILGAEGVYLDLEKISSSFNDFFAGLMK